MKKAGKRLFGSLGNCGCTSHGGMVQRLGNPDDPVATALMQFLRNREIQHKLEAGKALQEFDRKQWRDGRSSAPPGIRLRPESVLFKHLALEHWTNAMTCIAGRSAIAPRSLSQLRIGLKRFRYIVENFLPEQHMHERRS